MAKMQTLTINGQKFVVDDSDAVQKDSSAVSGAVPTADGNGGVSWQENTSDVVYVAVTETDGTYTADKTSAELLEAYNAGKTLVCKYPWLSGQKLIAPLWIANASTGSFVFRVLYKMSDQSQTITIVINGNGVSVSEDPVLPEDGTEGQILTKTATGAAWGDAPSGTFVVTVTGPSSGEYTADKTFVEIQAAVDDGMEVVLSARSGQYLYKLTVVAGSYFEFASTYDNAAHSFMIFTDDYVQYTETALGAELPTGASEGQVLTADADGNAVWADLPEQETELPTGGTAGQVLTIGSDGSPVWADPATLTSVYEGVF